MLDQSWKDLGSTAGVTYGVNYTYGDRSAIWYKKAHLEKAGVEPPKTWEEFIASIEKLKAAGYAAPIAMPAKYWAHGEWFETLLIRTGGLDAAAKLAVARNRVDRRHRQDHAQEVRRAAQGRLLRYARADVRRRLGLRGRPDLHGRRSPTTCSSACG